MIQNEQGVAWGYVMILLAVVFAGIMWAILGPAVNEMTTSMNEEISADVISTQSYTAYSWAVRVFIYLAPLACLASFVVWGFTRANMRGGD